MSGICSFIRNLTSILSFEFSDNSVRAERAGITCKSQMRNLKLQVLLSPAQHFTTTKWLGHEPPRFYSGSKAGALSTVCFDTLGRFGTHLGKKNWQLLLRNTEVCWEKQIWESCAGSKVKWEKTKGVKGLGHLPWFTPCVIVGKSLNFSTENSLLIWPRMTISHRPWPPCRCMVKTTEKWFLCGIPWVKHRIHQKDALTRGVFRIWV